MSVLEDSFVVALIQPEHRNRSKRLIKNPKLYFLDAGLAAHLSGWGAPEALRLSPYSGAAFETHILTELIKHYKHRAREVEIRFWRTRDGQEVDFLVEAGGRVRPIEVKVGVPTQRSLPKLSKIGGPHWEPGQVISLAATESRDITDEWRLVPPWDVAL